MSEIEANPSLIIVDNTITPPQTSGNTKISYEKDYLEEVWERKPGEGWERVNVHLATGKGDEAEYRGTFLNPITLRPGESYTLGIFAHTQGPLSTDPLPQVTVTVWAVLKEPEARPLIGDDSGGGGGTWYHHTVVTTVPTNVVLVGASRRPAMIDSQGIPHLVEPEGQVTSPLSTAQVHSLDLVPLISGHHYFFTLMVTDRGGNWQVLHREFTTLKRQLTVQFPRIFIYNDSDPNSEGEAQFWFRISHDRGGWPGALIQEFHLPQTSIDDKWPDKEKPPPVPPSEHPLGFAHLGTPETVTPGEERVWVGSWAGDDDAPEPDEGAGNLPGMTLHLPVGRSETVTNRTVVMDCPPSTMDSNFHYGVEIIYSVAYVWEP
jgi:hypothetical protein